MKYYTDRHLCDDPGYRAAGLLVIVMAMCNTVL